ncbi:hypothetical protein GCM10023313_03060 [Mucilaginibacter defluvii]|uniref:Uncharacterized protein n=1 Tax=Mucilaginibacter defluvii TaxID=1196019 RepID=A0ABP9FJ64_9SPHI
MTKTIQLQRQPMSLTWFPFNTSYKTGNLTVFTKNYLVLSKIGDEGSIEVMIVFNIWGKL